MKREHSIESKLPEGCVFYAPLAEDDLTDHVSGVSLTYSLGSLVTWNEEHNAYKFDQLDYSYYPYYTGLNFPYTVPFTPDFTREYDIFPVSSTYGNIYIFGHSISLEYGKSQPLSRHLNINTPSAVNYISRNNWHHIKEIFDADNSTYEFWVDGNLRASSALNQVTDARYSKNILRISCEMWSNGSSGVYFLLKNLQYYLNK